MSECAPRVFEALGFGVIRLFCEYDGRFPNRDPNPAVYSNLTALQAAVLRHNADLGVAFDGDGDRVVFVDDLGRVLTSERAFALFIREHLAGAPSSVVYDLKSSSVVRDAVLEMGGTPLMERSGHAFIKRRFLETDSALAGEISGHFFFQRIGYDDGLYAALEMAALVRRRGALSALADAVPRTLISPDLRAFCPYDERDALLSRVREVGSDGDVSLLDGVRVEYPYGWLLVRKSVTEEGVTARLEAVDEAAMALMKRKLLEAAPIFGGDAFFED